MGISDAADDATAPVSAFLARSRNFLTRFSLISQPCSVFRKDQTRFTPKSGFSVLSLLIANKSSSSDGIADIQHVLGLAGNVFVKKKSSSIGDAGCGVVCLSHQSCAQGSLSLGLESVALLFLAQGWFEQTEFGEISAAGVFLNWQCKQNSTATSTFGGVTAFTKRLIDFVKFYRRGMGD